ncbi:epithelial sodium channel subunit beta-like [Tubulanus polymorphus]|uniref:epithelial sodium channel subunit beta-like n=1 Tax=Tubulanus polymorphus TaxID=672921 RepID=UPI003DA27812
MIDKAEGGKTVSGVIRDWASNTNCHGVGNIERTTSWFRKIIWLALTLAAVSYLVITLASFVKTYKTHPVKTDVSYEYQTELRFPAVTICNVNPIRLSKIKSLSKENYFDTELTEILEEDETGSTNLQDVASKIWNKIKDEYDDDDEEDDEQTTATTASWSHPQTTAPINTESGSHPQTTAPISTVSGSHPQTTAAINTESWSDPQTAAPNVTDYEEPDIPGIDDLGDLFRRKRNAVPPSVPPASPSLPPVSPSTSLNQTTTSKTKLPPSDLGENVGSFTDGLAKIPMWKRKESGHQLKNMLKSCFYAGEKCLQLQLDIEPFEYIPDITDIAGVRVSINEPGYMPFPEDYGYYAAPGALTSISVKRVEVIRLPDPHPDKCVQPNGLINQHKKSVYSEVYGVDYTVSSCHKTCFQRHVFSICECFSKEIPFGLNLTAFSDLVSNGDNETSQNQSRPCSRQDACLDELLYDWSLGLLPCDCQMDCLNVDFSATISSAQWPNDMYKVISEISISSESDLHNRLFTSTRKNTVRLDVYYQEINFQKIQQLPSYDGNRLMADIGGTIGLWLGLSLLAVFELIELIFQIFLVLLQKLRPFVKISVK